MQCDAEFGMITRRHHCRACGRLVCGACSPHRARISTNPPRASQHRSSTFSLSGVAGGLVGETAPAVRVCVACHQNISGKLDIVLEDEATEELTADTKENSRSSACQGWTTRILRAVGVGSTPVDTSTQPDGKDGSDASSTKTSVSTLAANIMAASASNQINVPSRLRKDSLLVPTPFLASSMSSGSSYSVKAMAIAQRKVTADAGAVRNLARTGSIVVESPLSSSWSHDTGVTKRQMEQLQQLRRRGETCVAADTKTDSVDAVSRRAFQPLIAEAQRDALSKTMSAPPSSAPPPRPHRESFGRMLPITSRLESLENDKPHFPRKLSLAALREKVIKSGSGTDDHGHKIDEDDDDNYDPDDVVYTGFLIKRGNRFKSWKMRYLVLTRSELQWFKPDEYERQLSGERGKSANVSPHFLSSINLHDCVEVGYTVTGECILPQITTAMTSMLALGSNTASSRTSISVRDLLVMPDMRDLEKLESGAVSGPAFPFKLVSPSRTLYMVAFTAAEREEWVVKLTEAVRDAWHRHQLLDKENVSKSGSALSALVGGGPANLLTPL